MSPKSKYTTLWTHFVLDSTKRCATCMHCDKVIKISISSIGNLIRHIKARHPRQYTKLLNDSKISTTNATLISALQTRERSEDFSNELVRAVEKRPELYRGGTTYYERQQKWKDIASELGESVTYCKEEWRCLKKVFQSHMKEGAGTDDINEDMDQQMELMAFLVPYVNQDSDESEGEAEEPATQDDDHFEDPLDDKAVVFEDIRVSKPKPRPRPSRPNVPSKRKMEPVPDDSSKKLFLLSLMPDMRIMDNTQMRKFKRRVLDLIDEILNED